MRGKLDILRVDDSGSWQEALEHVASFDFYHMPQYHRLAQMRGEGEAIMPVFRAGAHLIAFPMLLRDVGLSETGLGPAKDVTSVYGYAGPLASAGVDDETIADFADALRGFFRENGVICAFSRLHPLMEQSHFFAALGEVAEVGATLSVDLTLPPEEQLARYRRNHRRDIRDLRGGGFTCHEAGPERLDEFVAMYHATMERAGADAAYFFDKPYFEHLLTQMPQTMRMFMCIAEDGSAASGLICGLCDGIVECHLAGTANDYVRLAPSKLLYDAAREWGVRQGARVMHMGGGLGSRRDSIHHLKLGFGAAEHAYRIWRYIADGRAYGQMCRRAWGLAGMEPDDSYFPAYRDPVLRK